MFMCELQKEIKNLHLTLSVKRKGAIRLDYFMFYKRNNYCSEK